MGWFNFTTGVSAMLPDYGLSFEGVVTTYTDTTHFKASSLLGKGTGFFKPTTGAPYEIFVVQADGEAPGGEQTPVVAYTSSDGTFQHAAFTVPLAVGDIVLIIHPLLASLGTKATVAAADAVTTTDYAMAYIKQLITELIVVDGIVDNILTDTETTIPGTITTLQNDINTIKGYLDTEIAAILAAVDTEVAAIEVKLDTPANFKADVSALALEATLGTHDTDIKALVDSKVMGRLQEATTTEDLNQVAGTYDLFTGTTQAVVLEKLNVKMPTGAAGGAVTSIAIVTDDVTAGTIISATTGAVANLTSEADLGWKGTLLVNVGTKIRLTIAGGAHGSEYLVTVVAQYRAVVSGGYLA